MLQEDFLERGPGSELADYGGFPLNEAGRLWDVLTMLRFAIRGSTGGARMVRFGVHVRDDNRGRMPPLVMLKAVCGPNDDGSPCISVMRPDED